MKRSAGHAMLMAKRPWLRKIYYGFLGGITTIIGWSIAYSSYVDYKNEHRQSAYYLIYLGLVLPIVVVGIEVYRYVDGAKKIRCVRCQACGKESALKAICKTGTCPSCNSKKLVGIRHDGSTI